MRDSFGDRMKGYENSYRTKLPKRMPVIIRIDGKAFSSYTKGMVKPFDEDLTAVMWETCIYLLQNIAGAKLAYTQSDEISILVTNYDKLTTESWFDNNLQKIVSVSASMATAKFNEAIKQYYPEKGLALFDSRAYVLPRDEVNNYFLWRQQDATKNSVSMVAQANFSHQSLQGLNGSKMQDKLMLEKGINWNDLPTWQKRGACVIKECYYKGEALRTRWVPDMETPIFSKDRDYIDELVYL
ncbi:tRNA-His guanylyltransferase [Bacillus phage vB_BmeM-Goe8]|uniref:Putative tRNAHis guanylyltransferase n=1 Tax=Bacillus phage vB_BmeM-Goe8 TaxID=2593638 RepID=A0A516KMY2_9CAUD|nr:tRNA-His guanylyltransferase [Bacillus phage vB_BmeM-Goe8]QDP42940.1 putative tRNAHis guanylyltransferase [Bacillus phage vB_BmeM-Goe8]